MKTNKSRRKRKSKLYFQKAGLRDLLPIYKSYKVDFPPTEQKPFWLILQFILTGKTEIMVLKNGQKKLLAYAIMNIKNKYQYALLDYLAVLKQYRSEGYGKKFITLLKRKYQYKNGIFIEIESIGAGSDERENDIRQRRLDFYLACGFIRTQTKIELFGVLMDIMVLETGKQDQHIGKRSAAVILDFYYKLLGQKVTDARVKVVST